MRRQIRLAALFCCLLLSVVFGNGIARVEASTASISSESPPSSVVENEDCVAATKLASAEAVILDFLKANYDKGMRYRVQGWRWHTMSLVRDARRLGGLAQRLSAQNSILGDGSLLQKAVYHVVDFNMKALHGIENDVFFPWMRKKLTATEDAELATAFATVLDKVFSDQAGAFRLGESVKDQVKKACDTTLSEADRMNAAKETARISKDLSSQVEDILRREDLLLVPAVAVLASDSEQKSINNKVIRGLGILNSRLHLVSMHETVLEQDDSEQQLYQQDIPSIMRSMIPRWKRNLYDPQAGCLEEPQ